MGVVMLHAHQRHAPLGGQGLRMAGRRVVGMQVAGDRLGHGVEEPDQVAGRTPVYLDGKRMLQVANVRRKNHRRLVHCTHPTQTKGNGVLQMAAESQDRGDSMS